MVSNTDRPTVLKQDMKVYKVLNGNMESVTRGYKFEHGKEHKDELETDPNKITETITFGARQYQMVKGCLWFQGFRSFTTREAAKQYMNSFMFQPNLMIVECVVKKGSKIVKSVDNDEIISDSLTVL